MLPLLKFSFLRLPAKPTPAFPKRHSVLMPTIPIRLINKGDPGRFINIRATIDSGADVSIFPAAAAEAIGLSTINERTQEIQGIDGSRIMTYLHDLILDIGGWKFATFALFTPDKTVFPVLGRDGFFSLFEVKIILTKELIELKPVVEPIKR
jgi:hypothetical protein